MLGDDHQVLGYLLDMMRGKESSQRERESLVAGMGMAWCSLGFLLHSNSTGKYWQ
jgi:hypothetical protein